MLHGGLKSSYPCVKHPCGSVSVIFPGQTVSL